MSWMTAYQERQFEEICQLIDSIDSPRAFYRVMDIINSGAYGVDVVNSAREYKRCYNSAQYA